MSTTNLFVELIVIGVGTFAWICLLLLAIFGINVDTLKWVVETPAMAIPTLSAIYLLGIVTDRLADGFFHATRMDGKHRERYAGGREQYFKDRAFVLENSEQFAQLYEYSRSRQRICRGWALNAIAILISFNLFVLARLDASPDAGLMAWVASLFFAVLALACWWSWEALSDVQLTQIKERASVLRPQSP